MKKLSLGAALVSALLASVGANAQTVPATGNQSGTISFTGSINSDACVVTGGNLAGSRGQINVDLGSVSMFSLGTQANPTASGTLLDAEVTPIELDVRCAAGTNVTFALDAPLKSGEGGNSIMTRGDAEGVVISLYRENGQLVQLGSATPAERTLAAPLVSGRTTLRLNAYYTKFLQAPVTVVKAGRAAGDATYTLTYN